MCLPIGRQVHSSPGRGLMKINRKLASAAISAIAVASVTSVIAAPSAEAAYGDKGYVVAPACVYIGPSYFYGLVYCTSYDNWLLLGCWTDDGQGHRWFSLAYQNQRWLRADDVIYQPTLPHC